MTFNINKTFGDSGNRLFTVLIFDADDMSSSTIEIWRAEGYEVIDKEMESRGLDENWYVTREIGTVE